MSTRKIIKKTGKVILYILGGIVLLLCILLIFINLPAGKRFIKNEAQSYLQNKIKTKVVIGSIDYSLPSWIELKNVYLEDQKKDTLISAEKIYVDISMLKLIHGNTDIQKLLLKNVFINVNRPEGDSSFNYQYIIDAFASPKSGTKTPKDTAALKMSLSRVLLDHVGVRFTDKFGGTDFSANVQNLDAGMKNFQPDRSIYGIQNVVASGVDFFMNTYKATLENPATSSKADTTNLPVYGLDITASDFDVRRINVKVQNSVSGMYYANNVAHLALSKVVFNSAREIAAASRLLLDSSSIAFVNPKVVTNQPVHDSAVNGAAFLWQISAQEVSLNNDAVSYNDNNVVKTAGFDVGHLGISKLTTHISDLTYSAKKTTALIRQLTFKDTSGFALDTTHVNFLMTDSIISAKELYVKTPQTLLQSLLEVRFDSLAGMTKNPEKSLLSVTLNNSTISFNDLYLLMPALKTSLPPAQFANNFVHFNTRLSGSLARAVVPQLQLNGFSGTSITAHGLLYNLTDAAKFSYDLFIDQSIFKKSDILKFVPKENQASLAQLPDIISLSGRINGNKENLVSDIKTSGKGMMLDGKFAVQNISDPKKLAYDITIRNSSFDKSFIMALVPPGTLPPQISLPAKNYVTGTLKGNTSNVVTDLRLDGSYGLVTVKGHINNMTDSKTANYDLNIETTKYQVGKLIGQDSVIGDVTGVFAMKGAGFDYKTMRSNITVDLSHAGYNKYEYSNIYLNARLNNGDVISTGKIDDPSLKLSYAITANVKGDYPIIKGSIRVDTAELKKLNLYPDTLNISLTAAVNSQNLQPRHLDASLLLDSIRMKSGANYYRVDSISLIASSAAGVDSIVLKAPFAEVHAGGGFDYDKVGASLEKYINTYYKIPGYKPANISIPDQQLAFNGIIWKSPLVTGFVPGLASYDPITFAGNYSSARGDSALSMVIEAPYIAYSSATISKGALNINSANGKINYELRADTLKTSGNVLYGTSVKGAAANDSILLTARTQDNNRKDWFAVSGTAAVTGDTYSFRMQDTLLLNYERWKVAPDNYFKYSPKGIVVNNFVLTSDTASISIKSQQLVENSPIDININRFDLKSITSLINQDTLFVGGVLNVKANVSDLDKSLPGFTGTADVTNLQVKQTPLGNLTASASKQSDNDIAASINLSGNGNDISAKGDYYLNNEDNQFDADLVLKQLNFRTIESLSGGQIRNSSGNINGEIKANGKFSDPRWQGQINFDTTAFTLTQLGTPYKIDQQKIVFSYPNIHFPEFTINDSLNHPLKIDGNIALRSMSDIGLDIDINTENFIFVNAKKAINSQIYGYGAIDADISVTGTAEKPNIDGDVSVNDKSDLTIVLPEASYEKNDGKTIVRFIDRDTFDINPPVIGFEEAEKPTPSFGKFLNYNLNIEISKEAALTILVDPVTGDEIKVQGDAELNAGVDPGGNIVLAGVYELDKGYYDLHYQILERKFNLIKGSTITFAGAPLNSNVNITAEYIANTNSKDLLDNEVSDVSPALANSFNQKLPFRVILKLSGPLSKPDISFDIELPEDNSNLLSSDLRTTIENKLQQIRDDPAAMNKQVFSLLLLGRFVGEQSSDFFKGNGGDFSTLARQSVSQFLSSALNQIAGDIFKGIDVDLNLNSYNDYSDGGNTERTDLNVAVSKKFANDRVVVSVGQSFGVEGQDAGAKASGANTGFKPDITVSYKLTSDGKYLLRAYTKNQFEVTVDGYVMETGLAFLVTMDYEKFNELFRRHKKGKKTSK